ncbi:MAG: T9SS type A sorting domain-containing protein [Bacteroidetes bacterium]|nr:T9SS type A sorting domain-containing protein [Bacteroidota bacterium]
MEFKFENILLPDSNIDEANSHGYLCYRIKPKTTLPPNDSLTNFASIYFDSNSPIRTNNAVTRILPPNVYIHLYATVCDNYVSPSGKYTWANSGIYLDTIPVGIGLDSIFIVHLTFNKSFSVIDTNDCENYVSPSGNYLWTTSGIYSDTLINALGCDSIITINLTINKSNSIINVTKCDSLTSPSSNYVWTTSGTYFDTIPNAKGCDSLITINLTIQQPFQINSTILMCQGDSTFLSGSWQTIAGFYFDSLQSIFGCDSFVTTQLIVNQNYNIISSASICSGDSIFIGGAWQFNAGNFVDNYLTLFGCDSIITTVVTVNPIYYSISDISICTGDSIFIGGAWQNVQGNYYDIFSTKLGCDSIFETALNINPVFNFTDTITILLGDSVFAGGAWQTTAGVYTDYYITQNSCDSIVTTVLNVVTGIAEYLSSTFINIKPNPGNGIFTIIFTSSEIKPSQLLIKNIQGQQLFSDDIISNQAKLIDITSLANGVFILQVNTLTRSYYYKLIKK